MSLAVAHVLFDLDGTLVDSYPGIRGSVAAAFAEVLPHVTVDVRREWLGPTIAEILRRALVAAGIVDETPLRSLEQAFRRHYDANGWRRSELFPDAALVLSQLHWRGVAAYVVTNKPQRPTAALLEYFGLRRLLVESVSPDRRSPPFTSKAEAIVDLLRRRDIDPNTALYVGDTADDARAAAAAGLAFVPVSYGYGNPLEAACEFPPLATLGALLEHRLIRQPSSVATFAG
jgi:phosphoglycolate phosphatase